MESRIGILGFGQMGEPIARALAAAGHDVSVYARRPEVRERVVEVGLTACETAADLAGRVDVILDLLTDVTATMEVLTGEHGLDAGLRRGQIFVDMTTSDPEEARSVATHLDSWGVDYLDAPVTGGALGAREGRLVLMVGGARETYERLAPVFDAISAESFYLGPKGTGHTMKLIHNQLSHSTFLAACEAVILGQRMGLAPEDMIAVFNAGNARSYATEVRFPRFILSKSFAAGASFATVHKDMSIVVRKERDRGLCLPITEATLSYWQRGLEQGPAADYSTIFSLMADDERRAEDQR